MLPFLHRHLPELRFLHVVRDGRDMALSSNQNQLLKHGAAVGVTSPGRSVPEQSIALWSWINLEAARYGLNALGERYLRVRLEDLCREPIAVTTGILDFFGLQASPTEMAAEVVSPMSLGRWRDADPLLVERLQRIGGEALTEFGYSRVSSSRKETSSIGSS